LIYELIKISNFKQHPSCVHIRNTISYFGKRQREERREKEKKWKFKKNLPHSQNKNPK